MGNVKSLPGETAAFSMRDNGGQNSAPCLLTSSLLQVAAAVMSGDRLELPPPATLLGPSGLTGLAAYAESC